MKLISHTGLIQQGLHIRPGHYLLAPERLEASRTPTLPQRNGTSGQGDQSYIFETILLMYSRLQLVFTGAGD
jgi:hypothetical protein